MKAHGIDFEEIFIDPKEEKLKEKSNKEETKNVKNKTEEQIKKCLKNNE